MSYLAPSEIFKKFGDDNRSLSGLCDAKTAEILNFVNLSSFDLNNIQSSLISPLTGDAKWNKQVTNKMFYQLNH